MWIFTIYLDFKQAHTSTQRNQPGQAVKYSGIPSKIINVNITTLPREEKSEGKKWALPRILYWRRIKRGRCLLPVLFGALEKVMTELDIVNPGGTIIFNRLTK